MIVPVRAVEPVVSLWRARLDPLAAQGLPPHLTVLNPFMAADRIDRAQLVAMVDLCAAMAPLRTSFKRVECTGGAVHLVPSPSLPFRRLTDAFAERWPGHAPAAGVPSGPHLTVGCGDDTAALGRSIIAVRGELPIHAVVSEAQLWNSDGHRWRLRCRMPFASATERGDNALLPGAFAEQ